MMSQVRRFFDLKIQLSNHPRKNRLGTAVLFSSLVIGSQCSCAAFCGLVRGKVTIGHPAQGFVHPTGNGSFTGSCPVWPTITRSQWGHSPLKTSHRPVQYKRANDSSCDSSVGLASAMRRGVLMQRSLSPPLIQG